LCHGAASGDSGFDCPRCPDRVCARPTCWNARYSRCRRCHELEIVILPLSDGWWRARVGARVKTGECVSCYRGAEEADLRECANCHWAMCKRCWDYFNGSCQKCDWTLPDLPDALIPFTRRARRDTHGRPRQPVQGRVSSGDASRGVPNVR
jgi:hypothetical protein